MYTNGPNPRVNGTSTVASQRKFSICFTGWLYEKLHNLLASKSCFYSLVAFSCSGAHLMKFSPSIQYTTLVNDFVLIISALFLLKTGAKNCHQMAYFHVPIIKKLNFVIIFRNEDVISSWSTLLKFRTKNLDVPQLFFFFLQNSYLSKFLRPKYEYKRRGRRIQTFSKTFKNGIYFVDPARRDPEAHKS